MEAEQDEASRWWRKLVEPYEKPVWSSGAIQLLNSVLPYLVLWGAMIWTIRHSYLLTLALVVPTAGFWVRIFIISHDCGHGSFFPSRRANHFWGVVTGLITMTPFRYWRQEHAKHHGSSGNLDRRGTGDIWTMTVREYRAASRWQRLAYRLYRNPFLMFGPGAIGLLLLRYRFTAGIDCAEDRRSVYGTNLALLAIASGMVAWIGWQHYLMILLPLVAVAASAGVWLFYVQHQFEGVYWERDGQWDYLRQAMEGSSYYKLPRLLQWFTGNIGFHHIHHLSHRIPNYRLARCHQENEPFRRVPEVTLRASLKSLRFRLWDEERRRLVSFGEARRDLAA